jgi:hypothetical protein
VAGKASVLVPFIQPSLVITAMLVTKENHKQLPCSVVKLRTCASTSEIELFVDLVCYKDIQDVSSTHPCTEGNLNKIFVI